MKQLAFILLILCIALAGCVQNDTGIAPVDIQATVTDENQTVGNVTPNTEENLTTDKNVTEVNLSENQTATEKIPANMSQGSVVPENTTQNVTPSRTIPPTGEVTTIPEVISTVALPDKNAAFRDTVMPMISLMQEKKNVVTALNSDTDGAVIIKKVLVLSDMINANQRLTDVPKKMDFVKVSYDDYIDQMTQVVNNYKAAAERLTAGDKASAKSYFDAGIIASDRADMAVKKIEVFFRDHITS